LSFGPKTPIYVFLHEHIVFFRGLRNVTCFGFLLFFSLSVLSSFALTWLLGGPTFKARQKWFAAAIAAFFLIESARIPLEIEPLRDEPPAVYRWLANQTQTGAIVELPYHARQADRLFQARHHNFRPSLGGTSRFTPISHQWMEILLHRFPSADSVHLLASLDVRYVIIHLESYAPRDLLRLLNGLAQNRHALLPMRDFGNTLVFGLTPKEVPHPPPNGSGRAIVSLASSSEIVDQDSLRRQPHASEAEFEIRLDSKSRVSGLRLHYGPHPRTPAERVQLRVLGNDAVRGPVWVTPPDWPALTELITGILDNPRDATQVVRFDPIEAERFQIRLVGSGAPPVISEIEVLGSPSPN
jgi:hypothetical protein